ncbi:hypothetical protein SAMN05216196_102323 [Lutimaribacter pacificus]|uniref:DUF2059 domain-containing protein n=1 Tax=Lutimaribacter pacificus TaxID=391948 RepID=A0A1H0ER64_9RHOB|nr:DUF2059 domain-containing protein [Lutimaribacter pacificus]SDN84868.1 hypothetical protein SAMN05216196_102323 [Lutimaribacter pacificus]SHK40275.1 hypothetical protein SAMN05444142_10537 [Lutimaribacter pacificus]
MSRAAGVRLLLLAILVALPLRAMAADIDRLFAAMQVDRLIDVMRDEGLAYGDSLEQDMLGGHAGPGWAGLVGRIYDTDKMRAVVRAHFADSFGDADSAPLIAFFESEAGRALVEAEIETREAFMLPGVEEAARALWREADKATPRQRLIADYVEVNGLLEYNVAGALNANYLFFLGLVEGGAVDMSEEDILADVWAQEDETRHDTREWLFAYLSMAYEDLPPATLEAYVALSRSAPGRALNHALFAGFDRMYGELSLSMGLAVASRMATGEEL